LPVRHEPNAPIQALRAPVVGVNRNPNFLTARSSLGDVGKDELHRRRPNSSPLLRHVNRQVKQVCVSAGVSEGNDPYNRGLGAQRERLPIQVARPDVRLGEDDKGDRLVAGDEPDLMRRDLHSYGRAPVVLIDECEAEGRRICHGAILAAGCALGNPTWRRSRAG